MLSDGKIDKYSDVLLWALKAARRDKFQKNDIVLIRYNFDSVKLAESMMAKLLELGMNPVMRMGLTSKMERDFFGIANNKQLVFHAPGEKALFQNLNGGIYLNAPASLTHLSRIDPIKIGKTAASIKPFREILTKREEKGQFGWTLCLMPTHDLAKHARLTPKQYSAQIVKACYLDKKDPVEEWKAIHKTGMAIKKWLNSMAVKVLHIESENIDLRITPGEKRRWVGLSGHNIPSFEIFLSPDYRGTEGIYYADQPSFNSGNLVKGVRLRFRKGFAVDVDAEKGKNFILKQTSIDKGARRVGEFSLTDKRFSRINAFMASTLYDENYGGRYGNCHLALGSSYSDTYDGNPAGLTKASKDKLGFNDSAIHWDLVNIEDKTVTAHLASGKKTVIYERGMFKY